MDKKRTIFLSGPMRGISREMGLKWRSQAKSILGSQFNILSPYRGREERETLPCSKAAILRDKGDILRSDIVIVNDTFSQASMIGTSMEVMYAFEHDKVIVTFGNAHSKDYWLDYHSTIRVETLDEACDVAQKYYGE